MEKFSLGKKIRDAVGIASIAGLSILAVQNGEKSENSNNGLAGEAFKPQTEINKWSKDELTNEEIGKIAKEISIDAEIEYKKFFISEIKNSMDELRKELLYRALTNKVSTVYGMTEEEIVEELKNGQDIINNYENVILLLSKQKQGGQKNAEEIILDEEISETEKKIKNSLKFYDMGREWVLKNINDPKYEERFEKEIGNKNTAKVLYNQRISDASDKNYNLIRNSDMENNGALAYYSPYENKPYYKILDTDSLQAIENSIHEYGHQVTRANKLLSSKAIELLSQSFDSLSVIRLYENILDEEELQGHLLYLSNPTEMFTRKKVLEHDLEKLGVKKYGEEFNIKHFFKALKLIEERKLRRGSVEFINSVKPMMLPIIMNTVAEIPQINPNESNTA